VDWRARAPSKNREDYFSGNYHLKFRAFNNFFIHNFRAEMSSPKQKLTTSMPTKRVARIIFDTLKINRTMPFIYEMTIGVNALQTLRASSPFLLPSPSFFPSLPFPFPTPLSSPHFLNSAGGYGEHCKLPQRVRPLGEHLEVKMKRFREQIFCIFTRQNLKLLL